MNEELEKGRIGTIVEKGRKVTGTLLRNIWGRDPQGKKGAAKM